MNIDFRKSKLMNSGLVDYSHKIRQDIMSGNVAKSVFSFLSSRFLGLTVDPRPHNFMSVTHILREPVLKKTFMGI